MKQNLRLDFAFALLRSRLIVPSPTFCSCGRNTSFSTSVQRAGSISYTEKIRRKIWGTDQPPGQEDPYGGPSALEQYRRENSKKRVDIQDHTQVPTQSSSPSAPRYNSELATYEPATTWDDLEVIGEPQENKYYFTGFLPVRIPKDRNKVTAALRQAIIEVFALKQADKSLSLLRDSGRTDLTSHVRVKMSRPLTAKVILEFPETTSEAELVEYLTRVDESASDSDVSIIREDAMADALDNISNTSAESAFAEGDGEHQNLRYSAQVVSWDPVWLQVSLDDPEVKFAIIKRVMRLTGIRISDPAIDSIRTVKSLLLHLVRPPKPKKLAEALIKQRDLVNLPNIKIFDHRITPIDREKSIGRWKIIEKALEAKDLPVTGH